MGARRRRATMARHGDILLENKPIPDQTDENRVRRAERRYAPESRRIVSNYAPEFLLVQRKINKSIRINKNICSVYRGEISRAFPLEINQFSAATRQNTHTTSLSRGVYAREIAIAGCLETGDRRVHKARRILTNRSLATTVQAVYAPWTAVGCSGLGKHFNSIAQVFPSGYRMLSGSGALRNLQAERRCSE
jgi:hypothetical protein